MVYQQFVEIGRVVFICKGKNAGKVATIVDVVDPNRILIDGPSSGVIRTAENVKNVQLTRLSVSGIRNGARTSTVKAAWDAQGLGKAWASGLWAQKLAKRSLKAAMTDLDRFKLMKAKQMRNRIVRSEMKKLKKSKK